MQTSKIKSYIGFAVRAGDVVFGLDNIISSRNRVRVIIVDSELGTASRRKLSNYLSHNAIDVIELGDISLGRDILRRDNTKVIGVLNESLASAIIREAGEQ